MQQNNQPVRTEGKNPQTSATPPPHKNIDLVAMIRELFSKLKKEK